MVGPEFVSCILKLGRAQEHLDTFNSEMAEWSGGKPYSISRNNDVEGARYGLTVQITKAPPLDRWSLIAGDCIHNLRSALDTFVYAVAVRHSGLNPPPNFDRLQFPITNSREEFEVQRQRRLAGLSNSAQAWIESAQPYNRPHPKKPPLLRLLNELANSDKHRTLNVALQYAASGKFKFTTSLMGSVPTLHYLRTPITSGTEFVFFTLKPPKRDVSYEYEGSIAISISHSPGPSGDCVSTIQDVLGSLIAEVKRIINGVF